MSRLMMTALLCLAVLSGCVPARFSRAPIVEGMVTDITTGAPLAGATVSRLRWQEPPLTAMTDAHGRYEIPGENYWGVTFISLEAPKLDVWIHVECAGYRPWTYWDHSPYGGGRADVRWTYDAALLPESDPLAAYSDALERAVTGGQGFGAWRDVLVRMREAGFSRHDARRLVLSNPGVFDTSPGSTVYRGDEAVREWSLIIEGGCERDNEVWPHTACADFLRELDKLPPHLMFRGCVRDGGSDRPVVRASYSVESEHMRDVMAYFQRETDMPEIVPQWNTWKHVVRNNRTYGLLPLPSAQNDGRAEPRQAYRVSMRTPSSVYYENDTLLIPNFYVDVELPLK